jgi:hypothetical protein
MTTMEPMETGCSAARDIVGLPRDGIQAFQAGKKGPGAYKGLPERQTDASDGDADGRWYRCRRCGSRIARTADRIRINGRMSHVFNNPAGYIFEIGCFAAAEGCVNEGQPTLEFTWFDGFSWRFALCGNCRTHLGWFYQAMKSASFYGLILAGLSEDTQSSRDR